MPGLGKYKKGKKFELKSGNSPAFKMMGNIEAGDSPITANNFGIGKGTSPLDQLADPDAQAKLMAANKAGARKTKTRNMLRTAANMFMAGINNVYGTPGPTTKSLDEEKAYERWAKEKADKETLNTAQQIIAADIKKKKKTDKDQ